MFMRKSVLASLSLLALGACVDPITRGANSDLIPPMIGKPTDNLRLGPPPPSSAKDVKIEIYDPKRARPEVTKVRSEGLREAAMSYGSQGGYERRAWEIEKRLELRSSDLSQVFDFNRVISTAPVKAGVIVPPVVSRAFDAFVVDNEGREASVADEYLSIIRPGRIAPTAPTWRDYLLFGSETPDTPAKSLLPSNATEKRLFEQWHDQGWASGVKLADAEFEERMNRLERDYKGMLQYRRLVAQGMMNRMVLANADFGVTKDGNEMRIGSRTVEIVSDAEFQSNPTRWQVRSVSAQDALIVESGGLSSISGF